MSGQADTIGEAVALTAGRHPMASVVIEGDRSLTYDELQDRATVLAAALLADGVRSGDRIGIWMPTGATWVTAFCAAARIGAIVVPVNTRYQSEEVRHVLTHAGVSILLAQPIMWRTDAMAMLNTISPDLLAAQNVDLHLGALPVLRRIVLTGDVAPVCAFTFDTYMRGGDPESVTWPQIAQADPLLICFTSGSTGKPKGVIHSHRVIHHCTHLAAIQGLEPGERSLANWPLHHAGGLFLLLIPALLSGAGLVVIDSWSGSEALRLIERERVTVLGGIPTHYLDLIDDPAIGEADLSSLRYCYMGGANVTRDTFDRIVTALDIDSLPSTYGLTENTVSATFNLPGDTPEQCAKNIAPVIANCEVRIVEPDTGAIVVDGEQGEIQFRGETLMDGYYREPEATVAAITSGGWLRTGDLGRLHPNGYLQPTGRLKEMLKVGGSNVSPTEVEAVLAEHPAVRNAVIVGVPDRRLTEVARAFVELRFGVQATPDDLISFCRTRMADYKVPRGVQILAELPRLSTGKIDRVRLAKNAQSLAQ